MFANLLYVIALAMASPLVAYRMVRHGRYRRGAAEKLLGLSAKRAAALNASGGGRLWLHAVSVGEVNLLSTLIDRLAAEESDYPIVVSTSTDSGYDLAVQKFGADRVFFCPLDFTWAVRRTLRHLRPCGLLLVELELWPNLIRTADRMGYPVMVANARLSQRSAERYRQFGWLFRDTFASLSWVGCQDQDVANRFMVCGSPVVEVTGSIKFDGAPLSRDAHEVVARSDWSAVDPWAQVWCMGSTQSGEERLALDVYSELSASNTNLRLMLVPRHSERFDAVAKEIESAGFRARRRSDPAFQDLSHANWPSDTVLLVDTIGELRHWWGVASIATVGGSFGDRGGQNMLEPAGYGCAVSFGPNTKNFADIANRLLNAGGAVRVHDQDELTTFVHRCLTRPTEAASLGRASHGFVRSQQGATAKSVVAIQGITSGETVEDRSSIRRWAA